MIKFSVYLKLSCAVLMTQILANSCKKEDSKCYESINKSVDFGFETNLNDWGNLGGGGEYYTESDIQISADTSSSGIYSCKFTVSPASIVAGGNRAELSFEHGATEDEESWFEYSFFIPTDYQDVYTEAADGAPNWQVLGQWHQQPVFCKGDEWGNFNGDGESPPIAIYYNYFDKNDPNYAEALSDPKVTSIHGMDPSWDMVSTIGLYCGSEIIAISKINKGEWNKLKFHIVWSRKKHGSIQAWLNDTEFTNGVVPGFNMLNKASHYFKFGLYRNPTIPYTNSVYYDDIKIW